MGINELYLLKWQRRSIGIVQKTIEHHQRLFQLTNHSKKKEKHKQNIKFNKDVLQLMLEEYDWH